ncbi:MAG: tetratricopeptide repeat protein [Acidobacteriota bacterium]
MGYSWTTLTQALLCEPSGIDEALAIAWEAVERFPEDVVARTGLAEVCRRAGRLEEAESVYRETVERFPEDVVARTGLAAVLRLQGGKRPREALELVEKVLEEDSSNVHAQTERGRILESLGRHREAEAAFAQASALESSIPTPVEGTGKSAAPKGKPKAFLPPAQGKTLVSYARFLRRQARRTESENGEAREHRNRALEMLDRVLEAQPFQTKARAEKGLLLLEWGRYEQAGAFLAESVALYPGDGALRYALARAERKAAQKESRPLSSVEPGAVTAAWESLHELNPAFYPLEQLGKGSAWLAHRDGNVRRRKALKAFSSLRKWTHPYLRYTGKGKSPGAEDPTTIRRQYEEKKGFEPWFSREVQALVFGPIPIHRELKNADLECIDERLHRYAAPIERLEEDFAVRQSAL